MLSANALGLDVTMEDLPHEKPSGALYNKIYSKAESWVSSLTQNPDDSQAKTEIEKLNVDIGASNERWGVPVDRGKIDLAFHIRQMQDAKSALDKLRVEPTDAQASMTLDRINQLVTEYNSRMGYPSNWIISKPSPSPSVAKSGSESNPVVVGAAGSSVPAHKSVGFADDVPIKQEAPDEDKLDFSESEEPPLITFDIGRTVDGDTGRLVGWSARTRGDVEIYAYGPRNAPLFLWKSGVATRDEKAKCPKIDKRRGEERTDSQWAYDKARVAGVRGICWRMDDYENKDDPYGLDLIDLSKFGPKSRYPPTLIQVEWDDKERTWETRTAFRRIWRNQKLADKQILASARRYHDRYKEYKNGIRDPLSRTPTPGLMLRESATISPPPQIETKKDQPQETQAQPSAEASKQADSKLLSLGEYMNMMKGAVPEHNTAEGLAMLMKSYLIFSRL